MDNGANATGVARAPTATSQPAGGNVLPSPRGDASGSGVTNSSLSTTAAAHAHTHGGSASQRPDSAAASQPPRGASGHQRRPKASSPPSLHHASQNGHQHNQSHYQNQQQQHQQPATPNSCIVLKNLSHSTTPAELETTMRELLGGRNAFANLSLVDDKNTGNFRGIAFVNFCSVDDARDALPALSALKVNNRKITAEYRRLRGPSDKDRRDQQEKRQKKLDSNSNKRATFEMDVPVEVDEHGNQIDKRTSFFAKRDTVKKSDDRIRATEKLEREKEMEADFRTQLVAYRNAEVPAGQEIQDVCFDQDLSSYERRIVHVLCDELELGHVSRSMSDGSRVLFVTKDPRRKIQWELETADARAVAAEKAAEKAVLAEEKKKKQREVQEKQPSEAVADRSNSNNRTTNGNNSTNGASASGHASGLSKNSGPPTKEELEGIKWFRPRAAIQAAGNEDGEDASLVVPRGIEKPSYKLYVPPRQPTGPDGTIGFWRRNRNAVGREGSASTSDDGIVDVVDSCVAGDRSNAISLDSNVEFDATNDRNNAPSQTAPKPRIVLNPNVPEFKFPVV